MDPQHIHEDVPGGVPLKMWTQGVPVEQQAMRQLQNAARLPIVFKHIAAMPDVHFGVGATVGSVIPTVKAIIPAAVGVDIGCGMMACKTTLMAKALPDNLATLRSAIERAVSHGRQPGNRDRANLPDRDLAYFEEGSRYFGDYVRSVSWAQKFAALNRELMMKRVIEAAKTVIRKNFQSHIEAVNCHHNYVQQETHFGQEVYLTRKGAVSAKQGQLGIIPGSMGARSYIVRGKGNADSFESCSHGAGRVMSRGDAKRHFTLADHRAATEGVECRKDKDVLDETPAASGLFTRRQWVEKAIRQGPIKAQRAARTHVRASAATRSGPWLAWPSRRVVVRKTARGVANPRRVRPTRLRFAPCSRPF